MMQNLLAEFIGLAVALALHDAVVLLGSPANNQWTDWIHRESEPRLGARLQKGRPITIVDHESGEVHAPVVDDEGVTTTDYAVVSRFVNPVNPARSVYAFEGAQTWGVAGAARMLTGEHAEELAARVKHCGASWQALVRVRVRGDEAFPELVDVYPHHPKPKTRSVVGVPSGAQQAGGSAAGSAAGQSR